MDIIIIHHMIIHNNKILNNNRACIDNDTLYLGANIISITRFITFSNVYQLIYYYCSSASSSDSLMTIVLACTRLDVHQFHVHWLPANITQCAERGGEREREQKWHTVGTVTHKSCACELTAQKSILTSLCFLFFVFFVSVDQRRIRWGNNGVWWYARRKLSFVKP